MKENQEEQTSIRGLSVRDFPESAQQRLIRKPFMRRRGPRPPSEHLSLFTSLMPRAGFSSKANLYALHDHQVSPVRHQDCAGGSVSGGPDALNDARWPLPPRQERKRRRLPLAKPLCLRKLADVFPALLALAATFHRDAPKKKSNFLRN